MQICDKIDVKSLASHYLFVNKNEIKDVKFLGTENIDFSIQAKFNVLLNNGTDLSFSCHMYEDGTLANRSGKHGIYF